MSDFAALQTALSGLLAHRRAMEVIGHNITNAATPGYSRQRVELVAAGAGVVGGIWARPRNTGEGVAVEGTIRIRDEFLEARFRGEVAEQGSAQVLASALAAIERAFPEPSDEGISVQLAALFASFDEAANQPGDLTTRAALLEQARTLTQTFHRTSSEIEALHADLGERTTALVGTINSTATRVAELNDTIRATLAADAAPHDLADQRDLLIDELSRLAGATARANDDGTVDVFIGDTAIVRGGRATPVESVQVGPLPPPADVTGFQQVEVRWAGQGTRADVAGGELGGLLTALNDLVPRQLLALYEVASTLVTQVNALHLTGQGLDPADVNLTFFDPAGTRASTIALSADVDGQPTRIALGLAGAGALDATVGQQLAALADSPTGPDAAYRTFLGRLAVEAQAVDRRARLQDQAVIRADNARESARGVNLDEEMVALVAAQRAYEASARVMTAVDELLEVLIMRTGVVGR